MKYGNVRGVISVGAGAIVGTLLSIPFLAMKSAIGLVGPILGAAIGGLVHRRKHRQSRRDTINLSGSGRSEPTKWVPPAIGVGISLLVLAPVIAGMVSHFALGEPIGPSYFDATVSLGVFVGMTGFIGSRFITEP